MEIGWVKPKEVPADWDEAKIKAVNFNSKALKALVSAVTNEKFKKISLIETAKEAWTIFQTTYEGIKAVNDSKLQRLTTSFEEIKMEEDEMFGNNDYIALNNDNIVFILLVMEYLCLNLIEKPNVLLYLSFSPSQNYYNIPFQFNSHPKDSPHQLFFSLQFLSVNGSL